MRYGVKALVLLAAWWAYFPRDPAFGAFLGAAGLAYLAVWAAELIHPTIDAREDPSCPKPPRPFKAGDVVDVIGVPGRADPAPGVVVADETTGLAYVKVAGCASYPVDVIRLTLVTPAEDLVRG